MNQQLRYRKNEEKVLGAGSFTIDHEEARTIIYTGLYEGEKIVALLVAIDDDADQAEIDRIGDRIVGACNSHDQLVAALEILFRSYKRLADSGDAGNWSLEDTDEGKGALAALAAAGAA